MGQLAFIIIDYILGTSKRYFQNVECLGEGNLLGRKETIGLGIDQYKIMTNKMFNPFQSYLEKFQQK